jgi:predicted RNA binding protein YcfA (HicA-like mRNA interferase family)
MPELHRVKPNALLRSLRRLAARRGWAIEISEGGNHTKVTLNGRRTVVGRHPADLKSGTFRAILKQLGIEAEDLEA